MSNVSIIEKLDTALVETDRVALIYAQLIDFAVAEFKYLEVFSDDAETKARARAAVLYIRTRTEGLGS